MENINFIICINEDSEKNKSLSFIFKNRSFSFDCFTDLLCTEYELSINESDFHSMTGDLLTKRKISTLCQNQTKNSRVEWLGFERLSFKESQGQFLEENIYI